MFIEKKIRIESSNEFIETFESRGDSRNVLSANRDSLSRFQQTDCRSSLFIAN